MKTKLLIVAISMIGCILSVANEDHLILIPKPIWDGESIRIVEVPLISGFGTDFESYCPKIAQPYHAERHSPSRRDKEDTEKDVNPASMAGIRLLAKEVGADGTNDVTIDYEKVKDQHWRVDAQLLRTLVQCIYQYGDSIFLDFKVRLTLTGIPKESELHVVLEKCVEERNKTVAEEAEPSGAEQPTTRPESKLEDRNKTQPKAEERNDFFLSFSKSPDERFSIGLDGTLGPEDKDTPEFDVHMARLYERKAGKFVGRKLPLSTPGCYIDFTNKKIGHENWEAFWHPTSKFVVLSIPVTVSEQRGPHSEFFYFQVTDTGILPMSPPDVTSHAFRSFKHDEEISIGGIYPEDWIEGNRLRVNIFGSHFDGGEAPDFRLNGVLNFHEDGNITVDSIARYQPEPDLQTE